VRDDAIAGCLQLLMYGTLTGLKIESIGGVERWGGGHIGGSRRTFKGPFVAQKLLKTKCKKSATAKIAGPRETLKDNKKNGWRKWPAALQATARAMLPHPQCPKNPKFGARISSGLASSQKRSFPPFFHQ
jgi:hypothetical protein